MKSQYFTLHEFYIIESGLQDFTSAQIAIFKYTFGKVYARQVGPAQIAVNEPAAFKISGWKFCFFIE